MSSLSKTFTSSVGRKFVMGLTGVFLVLFLVIHVAVNALIFLNDGGATFNVAANFMGHNLVVRVLEIGLFLGIIAHIAQSVILTKQNKAARPQGYAYTQPSPKVSWYSRSMGLLGTLILLFLVIHLYHFWWPTKVAVYTHQEHDTFQNIKAVFSDWKPVVVYLIALVSLSFHLRHGVQSAFRSIGCVHNKWTPVVMSCGLWFSVIVPIIFALMPIAIYFGFIS